MTDEEMDQKPWTEHGRERFRAAATALVDAIRQHSDELLKMTGPPSEEPIDAEERLTRAAIEYADAQLDYSGTLPSIGLMEIGDDDSSEGKDVVEPVATCISVLRRADYRVTNTEAVIEAGRRAYRATWPDDSEEEAREDVSHLGRAVYQIEHAHGLQALDKTEGLAPAGATTWVLEASELLGDYDSGDWPDDPFTVGSNAGERLLHRLDEVDS